MIQKNGFGSVQPAATIIKRPTGLTNLPAPSEVVFPGLFGWSPVPTNVLTKALGLDRGLWGTWRCRGIGPAELPAGWFRPAPGRPCYYRVDTILTWLAARRGERFDTLTAWRLSLARDLDQDAIDPDRVRGLVHLYAEVTERRRPGGVTFTRAGFEAYLASLLSAE